MDWVEFLKEYQNIVYVAVVIFCLLIFVFLILAVCKYLNMCKRHNYIPLNLYIIPAVLSLPLIGWGISILASIDTIAKDKFSQGFVSYIAYAMFILSFVCIIINIRHSYKCTGSLIFGLTNYLVQWIMGTLIAFTLGLALFGMVAFMKSITTKNSYDDF